MTSSLTSRQLPLLVGVAAGYVLAVVTHAAWAGSGNASATGGAAMRRPVGELRSTSTYKISTLPLPPASISAASPHRERLLIVSTMTYEHMYRRPNLARTALQLRAAGYDDLVWVVIEVRKLNHLCMLYCIPPCAKAIGRCHTLRCTVPSRASRIGYLCCANQ